MRRTFVAVSAVLFIGLVPRLESGATSCIVLGEGRLAAVSFEKLRDRRCTTHVLVRWTISTGSEDVLYVECLEDALRSSPHLRVSDRVQALDCSPWQLERVR